MAKTQFPTPDKTTFGNDEYMTMISVDGSVEMHLHNSRLSCISFYKQMISLDYECCVWKWDERTGRAEFVSYFPGK